MKVGEEKMAGSETKQEARRMKRWRGFGLWFGSGSSKRDKEYKESLNDKTIFKSKRYQNMEQSNLPLTQLTLCF
jgi:hypothetical protein